MSYQDRLNYAAIKVASVWDTEVDVNEALAGITPDNKGVPKLNYPAIEVDEIQGANEPDIDHANFGASDFSFEFSKFNFNGRECSLLAGVFGSDAVEPLFVVVAGTNNFIDFEDTAAATKAAEVAAGSYTGTTLAAAIAAALNATAGVTGTFTCTWSSSTLKFTIAESSGPSNFKLLWNTGTNKAKDIHTLCGYSSAADDTGAATYASDTATTGSGAYQHTLTMADDTDGIFFSYASQKGSKIHVVPSLKVMKATFTINNGMLKLSLGCRGTKVIDNSSVITAMTSVTYPSIHNATRAKYGQAVVRMNAQAGDALAVGDAIKPKNFTLEFERKMDNEHGASSYTVQEPRSNSKPTVKQTYEYSYMDAVNELFFAAWTAQTEQKSDLVFTGPVIVGTHTYLLKFELPRLHIEDAEYPHGGIIPAKIVMRALQADSAPTGMTGLVKPLTCTIVNTRSTSMLV